ncbi:MAG: MASE2 domain-containing protein [Rhodocyclaceae bacterium]|nr:MASE2 domain-containing protein [Rhodocyclaceae bacterium]
MTPATVMQGYDKQAMLRSPQSPSNSPIRPDKASRQTSLLQGKIYIVRAIFSVMALVLLAVNDVFCHGRPADHVWLLLAGVIYPHLGQLLLGRFDISRRRGHALFLIDGLFVGAVIGALEFAMLPSTVLAVISLFNWMVVGGPILVALGITLMFAGLMTAGTVNSVFLVGTSTACNASDWLASAILLGYFLIVARIIHQLVGELQLQQAEFQARTDSASVAKNLAERALLAVLPASAAQTLAEKGELVPESVQGATLLLVEFGPNDNHSPAVDDLKDNFHVCDMIMARHGFELVKTFGRRAFAMSRRESGPDDALRAMTEIDSFFADHRSLASPANACRSLRGVLHHGPVTIGLVQPERLNLDLLGETVDELAKLEALAGNQPTATLIASVSAYRKLHDPVDFVPLHGNGSLPTCYLYTPGQPS